MFKVRNNLSGTFSLTLEKGSITLQPGGSFDIEGDGGCSRKWIKSDPILNSLLRTGTLSLVHDSAKGLPKAPIGDATASKKAGKPGKPKKPPKPTIVDFGKGEDIDLKKHKEEAKKAPPPPPPKPKKPGEELPDVFNMKKYELIECAESHGIALEEGAYKDEVREAILESDWYKDLEKAWGEYEAAQEG
jgi:hypothetical protein